MKIRTLIFSALLVGCVAIFFAQNPKKQNNAPAAQTGDEELGPPVFPPEMTVSLWDENSPVCYEHRDTITGTEYGTCHNFNRLDFRPDGDDGVIMTWYATASYSDGFFGECTYVYKGTRDLNVVSLESRRFEDDAEDEVELLDPGSDASLVTILDQTHLRFNNRLFKRIKN